MNQPQTTRPPQDKVCGYEYTVRRGDSFYLIANRLGVPLRDLLAANENVNPARLMVGDVLCIPMEEDDQPAPDVQTPAQPLPTPEDDPDAPAMEEAPPAAGEDDVQDSMGVCPQENRYTVRAGESVADIQLARDLSLQSIAQANPEADLSRLSAGQVLCLPDKNIPCDAVSTYTMQLRDTLESVALMLNLSIGALLRANPCLSPSDFIPGAVLQIPQK